VQVARPNATDGASTTSAVEVVEPVEEAKCTQAPTDQSTA
jgi:hypothetical protein